mmetsp:Transcript_79850/g.166003  ORF Transcript_79850/g.166003 Transcript_79850/m.166003 type:complete len:93 (+) Transcript_79850:33-311(+)
MVPATMAVHGGSLVPTAHVVTAATSVSNENHDKKFVLLQAPWLHRISSEAEWGAAATGGGEKLLCWGPHIRRITAGNNICSPLGFQLFNDSK